MKANELAVGDWAFSPEMKQPITIKAILEHNQVIFAQRITNDVSNRYQRNCSEIEPIPLTPEILEKNSDGSFFNHDSKIIGYDGKRSTYHLGKAILYVEWERISMKPYIEIYGLGDTFYKNYVGSVHELQHALRLCDIDKEIVI